MIICYCEIKHKKSKKYSVNDCNTKKYNHYPSQEIETAQEPISPMSLAQSLFSLSLKRVTHCLIIYKSLGLDYLRVFMYNSSKWLYTDLPSFHFHYYIAPHWMDTKMHLFSHHLLATVWGYYQQCCHKHFCTCILKCMCTYFSNI